MIDDADALTPRMREVLQRIRRAGRPPFHVLEPAAARSAYAAAAEILDLPRARLPRVDALLIPGGDASPRPARLYANAPAGDGPPLPALLYLHGGGFTIGGLDTHDSLCRQIALRSGAAVVSLDYRLAPTHRFPAAVDDSFAALRWLHANARSLALDASRLAVGGDSAGGTLATVSALQARDAGVPIALQVLITPGTAAHASMPSRHRFAEGFLLDAATIDWFFGLYIDEAQRGDWRFAPLLAPDLDAVAPVCMVLAECDPLVDEGLAYADRLRMAGVAVQLELFRGVTHDFIKMGRMLPEAEAALEAIADALKRALS